MGKLIGGIALVVAVGTPFVAYIWETLNLLLSGIVQPGRLAIAAVLLAVFWFYLRFVGRLVERWSMEEA